MFREGYVDGCDGFKLVEEPFADVMGHVFDEVSADIHLAFDCLIDLSIVQSVADLIGNSRRSGVETDAKVYGIVVAYGMFLWQNSMESVESESLKQDETLGKLHVRHCG